MAQNGIEADLASLCARILQIEQEREIKKKEWAKLRLIALWVAIGFLVHCAQVALRDARGTVASRRARRL